ncbi:DNA adenine methylase [Salmonella enterica subsp. enterica]|nr:DNA adenine methylase [Salmonella enterica subsp. enterica]
MRSSTPARLSSGGNCLSESAMVINLTCRYNLRGEFNVPFGRYKDLTSRKRSCTTLQKAANAFFTVSHTQTVCGRVRSSSVVYCDPPYAPLSATANPTPTVLA